MRVRHIPVRRWFNIAVAIFVVLLLIALILPAIEQAREAARRTQVKNTLHCLGLALHNYHDTFRRFPPGGVIDADGTPYHGWCLMILPYVDANPFYPRVDLDCPWDDPENDYLWRTELRACLNPSVKERRTSEGYGLLHYQANPHLLHRNSSVSLADLKAGTTETWMLGEAAGNFTPYAYPFNWRSLGSRLNADATGYGLPGKAGCNLMFADATVRSLSAETSGDVLSRLAAAPPVPAAEDVAVPTQPAVYRYSGRHEVTADLRDGPDSEPWALALVDRNDVPIKVTIVGYDKSPELWPDATTDDLRRAVAAFPGMKQLIRAPVITDETADVLSSLVDLELLHAKGASLSDEGLKRLAVLPKLKRVALSEADETTIERLRAALPSCQVEIHSPVYY